MAAPYSAVDALFERFVRDGGAPGIAFGITLGGRLVHSGAFGSVRVETPAATPTADSVFRVASMTKSFTAAAVLLLRDRGALSLDADIKTYLPEFNAAGAPDGAPPLTLRLLLSMNAGLATDDPWGDRLEDLDAAAFGEMLARGFSYIHAPGTRYEYSNLSYAIAGRIVARVSGHPLHEFVRSELLEPLGMQDSHFSVHRVDAAHLAIGHSRPDSQGGDAAAQEPWQAEPFTEPGEFSAIGGLFSSVRSLAVWVCGFVRAFGESGATDADDAVAHPLSAASRREMQQTHRSCLPRARTDLFLYGDESLSYGFGLAIEADARFGVCVSHSGGYPGYGSHMRWDPTTGLGVIALANGRYADAQRVGKIAHRMLLEHARPTYAQIVLQRPLDCVWPSTWAAHASVRALLREWDDSVCDVLFAVNVDLDETREHRRQSVVTAVAQVGGLIENDGAELDAVSNVRCDSASEMVWHERGRNGHVKVEIQMSPQSEPLLQTMRMTAVPAAIAAVSAAGAAGDASTAWAAAPAPAAFRIFIALAAADRELVESTWPAGLVSHAAVISRSFASFAAARAIDGPLHWADESLHEPNVWRVCGRAFVWGLRVLEAPLERAAEDSRSPAAAAHAQSLVSVCELVLVDKR